MKRISAILLAILLLLTQCVSLAEGTAQTTEAVEAPETVQETPETTEEDEAEEKPARDLSRLIVGNPTQMRGEFFTELWGNATSDIDVRMLLHGCNLVFWDGNMGMFAVNPSVVTEAVTEDAENGDRRYILTLADDLYYSDGSKITAWDYAFSILFEIAPELAGAGGTPVRREHLAGFDAYLNGKAAYLAGVHVEDDNTLIITVRGEYLPFFYEYGMLYYTPYPIGEIAPGVAVKDDGNGVYLANADDAVKEPVFTSDLIKKAVLDPETGYMSHPAVVSGPYKLTSWDGTTAEFEINTYFKGDPRGNVPVIPKLIYTLADNNDMIEKLQSGEFDLLNKVTKSDSITAGVALIGNGDFGFANYLRTGLSYISFCCEKPAVASQAVRQAIAWCMDRDQMTKDYTDNYGLRVDGYYGIGQWMYGAVNNTITPPFEEPDPNDALAVAEYEATLEAWDALNLDDLTVYTLDVEKAKDLLDKDGWKLNDQGIREKTVSGKKVALDLKMIYPEGNAIKDAFEANLLPNLKEAGINLTLEPVPMSDLLSRYYKQGEERDMDMIYLATNFDVVFDPSVQFIVDSNGEPNWSYTNHKDEELYELAVDMRETEPNMVLDYMNKWISFQERFNTVLPMLPIYSNTYFDFYISELQNYNVAESVTWTQAIVPAYLVENAEEEPAEETQEPADDGTEG